MSKQADTTRACAALLDMLERRRNPGLTDSHLAEIFVNNEFEFRTLYRYTMAALAKDFLRMVPEDDE